MSDQSHLSSESSKRGTGLRVIAQYLKDLSFENPYSPFVFQRQGQPDIDVHVDVNALELAGDIWEVALRISVRAKQHGDGNAFRIDLLYAGLFDAAGMPKETVRTSLLTEGAQLLFPFAQIIVADQARNGNFPPLLLGTIDFVDMHQRQRT